METARSAPIRFRTQRDVDRLSLPAGMADKFYFDVRARGLSVRLQRHGKPSWTVWYTAPGGRRKRITLGAVAGLGLDRAREQAGEILAAARNGRDPGGERKAARAKAAGAITLGDLLARYRQDHCTANQRPRTLGMTDNYIAKWKPLAELPIAAITRQDVSGVLLRLQRETGKVTANRTRACLSGAFAWAIRAGLAEQNPVVGSVQAEEEPRSRVLKESELRAIWAATGDGSPFGRIVRMLALTGARRSEVGGMAWSEIDLEQALWTLPAERVKNGLPHDVHLSRQALATLPERQAGPFVFGQLGRTAFGDWGRAKRGLDEQLKLEKWTLHDLRRSFVTHMHERAITAPHVIEAIVNHVSGHKGGVAGVYNRAKYRDERRAALAAWAEWLAG